MDGVSFVSHLSNYIGETVTIFTTSGGESGSGFTGVLLSVNNNFVRLITQIGIAPGCALGNCCEGPGQTGGIGVGFGEGSNGFDGQFENQCGGQDNTGRFTCTGNTLGSVTDIPIDRIASFVHNAI
ncbi:hypothetical protein GOM49_17215 [Clostridium bovifaecis]|uniref:Uncharacterized protein n=1 Tax=Clostridium bovifaecis TaxID=2184719 RepID=A0A6I6FFA3_9CLOT|nr:hypothetical protein GOM49_17215 [Clostridium bovifaecis]